MKEKTCTCRRMARWAAVDEAGVAGEWLGEQSETLMEKRGRPYHVINLAGSMSLRNITNKH